MQTRLFAKPKVFKKGMTHHYLEDTVLFYYFFVRTDVRTHQNYEDVIFNVFS